MNFNIQRHCRVAGTLIIVAALLIGSFSLLLYGNLVIAMSYMWTIAKIERHFEEQIKEDKDELL